jgi:hypothetical protein
VWRRFNLQTKKFTIYFLKSGEDRVLIIKMQKNNYFIRSLLTTTLSFANFST